MVDRSGIGPTFFSNFQSHSKLLLNDLDGVRSPIYGDDIRS